MFPSKTLARYLSTDPVFIHNALYAYLPPKLLIVFFITALKFGGANIAGNNNAIAVTFCKHLMVWNV